MNASDLVTRLTEHATLHSAPRVELQWLADHGSLRHLAPGEVLTAAGQHEEGLYVVLSGRIAIWLDSGGGLRKAVEWSAGEVTGALPYSRLVTPPASMVAQEPTEVLDLPRESFPAMIRECGTVTTRLVHTMLDRARAFNASELHDEKLISLGKLSAGLAHELNNPASAIARNAALLGSQLQAAE